ncbi:MAG: hypothetical protein LBU76_10120 [Azoarcus sp.]|jgi:hypothetical protein|nr:hypothetical protein [Azoarcus sp.]
MLVNRQKTTKNYARQRKEHQKCQYTMRQPEKKIKPTKGAGIHPIWGGYTGSFMAGIHKLYEMAAKIIVNVLIKNKLMQ